MLLQYPLTFLEGRHRQNCDLAQREQRKTLHGLQLTTYCVPNHEMGPSHENSERSQRRPPEVVFIPLSHSRGPTGSERLCNFPRATQLKLRAGIQTQLFLTPKLLLLHHHHILRKVF